MASEQEQFWLGDFGDEYTDRHLDQQLIVNNTAFFAQVLKRTTRVTSVLEVGANAGLNLKAIRTLLPAAQLAAVEINERAASKLRTQPGVDVFNESLLTYCPPRTYDFVLSKGVLIHLAPDQLPTAYNLLHKSSSRYVCIAEYYNPTPVEVPYRGYSGKLFKRDFAGEFMDRFPATRLIDYGFVYHRDPQFPQDDTSWFLIEKLKD